MSVRGRADNGTYLCTVYILPLVCDEKSRQPKKEESFIQFPTL